jgi:hypothetical protein
VIIAQKVVSFELFNHYWQEYSVLLERDLIISNHIFFGGIGFEQAFVLAGQALYHLRWNLNIHLQAWLTYVLKGLKLYEMCACSYVKSHT